MRLRWCGRALLAWLRRWGAVVLLVAAVMGAGVAGGLTVVSAVAAWMVLPLFYAVSQSALWGVAATAAQAAVGAGLLFSLRPWLLPATWLEAERALPLSEATRRGSDLRVLLWALSPLLVLWVTGAAVLTARKPAWLAPHLAPAWLALVVAALAALALGMALLKKRRQPQVGAGPAGAAQRPRERRAASTLAWPGVLLWLPLWRGPARRCGATLLAALLVHGLLLSGLLHSLQSAPSWAAYWLSAVAAWTLISTSRAAALVAEDTQPLVAACAALPLSPTRLQAAALALPLLPQVLPLLLLTVLALVAGVGVGVGGVGGDRGLRPAVLMAFTTLLAAAAGLVAFVPVPDAGARAGRLMLLAAVLFALASAVWP